MMTHMLESSTPASLGYFMPAEWEPHSGTWLAWPHNLDTWNKDDLYEVENIYVEIIRSLIDSECINILINDENYQHKISILLKHNSLDTDSIYFHNIPTEDAWIRDFGPNFLTRETLTGRQIAVNRWRFNSWGEKYPWEKDDNAEREIVRETNLPWFDPGIILEGGAIDVNGKGSCLTTTCLLHSNRNGNLSMEEMEKYFSESLHQFKEGQVIQGTIIELAKGIATIDIGFKSEGTIHLHEFPNNGQDLSVGEEVEVFLSGPLTAAVFKPKNQQETTTLTALLMPLRTKN